jgi:hypothetical protein
MENKAGQGETETNWKVVVKGTIRGPQAPRSLWWIIIIMVLILILMLLRLVPQIIVQLS